MAISLEMGLLVLARTISEMQGQLGLDNSQLLLASEEHPEVDGARRSVFLMLEKARKQLGTILATKDMNLTQKASYMNGFDAAMEDKAIMEGNRNPTEKDYSKEFIAGYNFANLKGHY